MNGTILDHAKVNAILSEKNIYDPFVIRMGWESFLEVSLELCDTKRSESQGCTFFKWNNVGICWIKKACGSDVPKGMKFINFGNLLF